MLVVARDGIEPPTPAFSGLDSSIAITNKLNDLHHSDRLESTLFWDSNGTEEWDNNPGRSNLPSPSIVPLPLRPNRNPPTCGRLGSTRTTGYPPCTLRGFDSPRHGARGE